MRNYFRKSIIRFFLFLFFVSFSFFYIKMGYSAVINKIIAVVDDKVITEEDLDKAMAPIYQEIKMKGGNITEDMMNSLRRQILNELIDIELTRIELASKNIPVTEKQVDMAVKRFAMARHLSIAELKERISNQGMSFDLFRDRLKAQIERERLLEVELRSKLVIPEDKLKKYYDEHKDKYGETIELHIELVSIDIPPYLKEKDTIYKKIKEIYNKAKEGESCSKIREELDKLGLIVRGGDLGWIDINLLDPDIQKEARGLNKGEVSSLLKTEKGYRFFKVLDKKDRPKRSFEEVKEEINKKFLKKEFQKRYKELMQEIRKRHFVEIYLK